MSTATRWLRPEPFRNPWRAVAVALLPLMILGLLISALWNPQDRLDTVKAAIVNLDEPVKIDGQTVPLGRQLAAGLVSGGETADVEAGEAAAIPASDASYDWEISDQASAADGLADGTYTAVVTIPEGFSAAATSFSGDDPDQARQATIDVATPANGHVLDDALAQVVAQTATGVLGSALTETYVDQVLLGFSTLSEQLGEAADGADRLAEGANEAGQGAEQLADGAGELADGASEAGDGAKELAAGARQTAAGVAGVGDGVGSLAGGAGQWASGANQWAAGANQLSGGVAGLASGAEGLADGAGQVADGVGQSADGAQALADSTGPLAQGAAGVATGVTGLADGADSLASDAAGAAAVTGQLAETATAVTSDAGSLLADAQKICAEPESAPQIAEFCDTLPQYKDLPAAAGAVDGGLAALSDTTSGESLYDLATGASELSGSAEKIASIADQVAGGAKKLSAGSQELADGLSQLRPGSSQVASGATELAGGSAQLALGVSGLAAGADELSAGAGGISFGATQLASGAGQLASGSSRIATGVDGLATGVGELETGTERIATGVDGLADGVGELAGGVTDLSDGLGQATQEIPSYTEQERRSLSSVVADPVATDGAVTDLDTGATGPMFAVLALWLGALALMIVFPPVPLHARGSTRGALRLMFETFAVPAVVGLVTGLGTGAVLAGIEGLDLGGWLAATSFGALVSVAFVAANQALAAALGHVGRGASLLIAVLVIATGVVSTVPTVLEGLAAFLPVGPAIVGLGRLAEPGTGSIGTAITATVLWGLAGLAVTTFMVARRRTVRVADLRTA